MGEGLRPRVGDIDAAQRVRIRDAEGNKGRLVPSPLVTRFVLGTWVSQPRRTHYVVQARQIARQHLLLQEQQRR